MSFQQASYVIPKSLLCHSNKPPMSFQRRHVGRGESIGGGTKKENHIVTASTAIDPMPLLT